MTDDRDTTDADRSRPSDACGAPTRAGAPCRARPLASSPSGRCFAHAPELDQRRADARRRGGRNSGAVPRARALAGRDFADVLARLYRALAAVEAGALGPSEARAMAALARAIVAVHDHTLVEARLAALEARLGIGKEAGRGRP